MLPIVLVPGLLETPRYYAAQLPSLWRSGAVVVANHASDDSMPAIAERLLRDAPPRFVLIGHSMGGYVAFEVLRQAPQRVVAVALTNTAARPDTPEQSERRRALIDLAKSGRFGLVAGTLFPNLVAKARAGDADLQEVVRRMADDTGSDAFVRQQNAIIGRVDSRPTLAAIRCPTLVVAGDSDAIIPPDRSLEIADGIRDARLVTLPECGHLSALERPDDLTRKLIDWLDETKTKDAKR